MSRARHTTTNQGCPGVTACTSQHCSLSLVFGATPCPSNSHSGVITQRPNKTPKHPTATHPSQMCQTQAHLAAPPFKHRVHTTRCQHCLQHKCCHCGTAVHMPKQHNLHLDMAHCAHSGGQKASDQSTSCTSSGTAAHIIAANAEAHPVRPQGLLATVQRLPAGESPAEQASCSEGHSLTGPVLARWACRQPLLPPPSLQGLPPPWPSS